MEKAGDRMGTGEKEKESKAIKQRHPSFSSVTERKSTPVQKNKLTATSPETTKTVTIRGVSL